MTQMMLGMLAPPKTWTHIPVEDPAAAAIYDRHYSRQTVGSSGILPPGERFLFWHQGARGFAIWGVVRNRFRGVWRWRNAVFRNESSTRSSDLIREATIETYAMWARRYKQLPPEYLESEIDIDATADRRSKNNPPGHCYAMAGWEWNRSMLKGHGRPRKAIYRAPSPSSLELGAR